MYSKISKMPIILLPPTSRITHQNRNMPFHKTAKTIRRDRLSLIQNI